MEPISISVTERELRHALATPAGTNALLTLQVDGTDRLVLCHRIQKHPVRGYLSHVDFLVVGRNETRTVEVPLVLVGEAESIRLARGSVDQEVFSIHVRAAVQDIPGSVEVDISSLEIGDVLRLADLHLPPGAEAEGDPDLLIVAGSAPHAPEALEEEQEAPEARAATAVAEGEERAPARAEEA